MTGFQERSCGFCLRASGVPECYVNAVQDMYDGCLTAVKSAVGVTEYFKVEVGLHQGSAFEPLPVCCG